MYDVYFKERVGIKKIKKGKQFLGKQYGRSLEVGNSFVCLGNFSLNFKEESGRN